MINEAESWWRSRRLAYNLIVLAASLVAFVSLLLIESSSPDSEAEVTLFTLMFQLAGFAAMLGAANLCYSLGALSEAIIKPQDVRRYRTMTFVSGSIFSVMIVLSIPLLTLLT